MNVIEMRENNFDLIRLLAAMQVVLVHGYQHLSVEVGLGFVRLTSLFPGVPIFFVISGFLISASWENSKSIKSYTMNRILRIYPALIVCFFVSCVSFIFIYDLSVAEVESTDVFLWIAAQLSIGQFYNPQFLRDYGVGVLNGSLWTIPVELQFYIILPSLYFLANAVKKKQRFVCVCVIYLLFVFLNLFYVGIKGDADHISTKLFGVTIFPYLYLFLLGVILQRNRWFVKKYLAGKAYLWVFLYLLVSYILKNFSVQISGNYLNPLSATALGLLVIAFAYSHGSFSNKVLRGHDLSYGIYIYHMIFVNVLVHIGKFEANSNMLIMLALTLIASYLSWIYIEKPMIRLKKISMQH